MSFIFDCIELYLILTPTVLIITVLPYTLFKRQCHSHEFKFKDEDKTANICYITHTYSHQ